MFKTTNISSIVKSVEILCLRVAIIDFPKNYRSLVILRRQKMFLINIKKV